MYWTNAAIIVLLFAFVVTCGLLCLVVMMQRSKQEGLGAAFGGGFTESVWGAGASQVLVKATVWMAAFFFIFSIALARLYAHRAGLEKLSPVQQELLRPGLAPAAAPTNAAPPVQKTVPTAAAFTPATNTAPVMNAAPTNAAPAVAPTNGAAK